MSEGSGGREPASAGGGAGAEGEIVRITGSVVEAAPLPGASLFEVVRAGERRLMGEVVRVTGERATIQVYEDTTGLRVGEPVEASGRPLTVSLGPGLLSSVLDGLGNPLERIARDRGDMIRPGATAPTLSEETRWRFEPSIEVGARVGGGDVLGSVQEGAGFRHRILVPPGVSGEVAELEGGTYAATEAVGRLDDETALGLSHAWPLRTPRPVAGRLGSERPLVTGQRILDFLFPVSRGGSVAVPGGFGTGKTVVEQSLAKHADADVVIYVGCGERGNEIAEVLAEFPELEDPRSGGPLMERTVLVVNTSNMPIAAREASIYLGVTVGEYFRDMGYDVALMADSISRWAEALREMTSRLREMPGEEGYPTYLADRLGKVYERAGRARAAGSPEREGSLTFIGAVSPPAGDLSEPVTQAALRVTGTMWALDADLAHQRHFPAVDWETSYSLYVDSTADWFREEGGEEWAEVRRWCLDLLQRDAEVREIAGLVGADSLQDPERFLMEAARLLRETVLAQSAFDPQDASSPVRKTYLLFRAVRDLDRAGRRYLDGGGAFSELDLAPFRKALVALRRADPEALEERAAELREALDAAVPASKETE